MVSREAVLLLYHKKLMKKKKKKICMKSCVLHCSYSMTATSIQEKKTYIYNSLKMGMYFLLLMPLKEHLTNFRIIHSSIKL